MLPSALGRHGRTADPLKQPALALLAGAVVDGHLDVALWEWAASHAGADHTPGAGVSFGTMQEKQDKLWDGASFKLEGALESLLKMGRLIAERPPGASASTDTRVALWIDAAFDGLVVMVRSLPDIIRCCFGHDENFRLTPWWDSLPSEEQRRRQQFSDQFDGLYRAFCRLPLSDKRHVSLHRSGRPAAELFPVCQKYLQHGQKLVSDAHVIVTQVHGNLPLTPPPG
jgi:hypothetical protein